MVFKIHINLGEQVSNIKQKEEESGFEITPRWALLDFNLRGQQKMRSHVMCLQLLGHTD